MSFLGTVLHRYSHDLRGFAPVQQDREAKILLRLIQVGHCLKKIRIILLLKYTETFPFGLGVRFFFEPTLFTSAAALLWWDLRLSLLTPKEERCPPSFPGGILGAKAPRVGVWRWHCHQGEEGKSPVLNWVVGAVPCSPGNVEIPRFFLCLVQD